MSRSRGSSRGAASTSYWRAPELDVAAEERPERAPLALVRHADAAGVDDSHAVGRRGRTARACARTTTTSASTPRAAARTSSSGVMRVIDLLVGAGVAWQTRRRPEPVDVELDASAATARPIAARTSPRRARSASQSELVLATRSSTRGRRCRARTNVAPSARSWSRHSGGNRPPDDVAAADDSVDPLARDLGEHRLERGQVAVDVAERGDAHDSRRSRGRSRRGPAQTRSSAGQPAQANSLGVGTEVARADARDRRRELGLELRRCPPRANVVETTASGRSRKW